MSGTSSISTGTVAFARSALSFRPILTPPVHIQISNWIWIESPPSLGDIKVLPLDTCEHIIMDALLQYAALGEQSQLRQCPTPAGDPGRQSCDGRKCRVE